jgi:hypothetical protein
LKAFFFSCFSLQTSFVLAVFLLAFILYTRRRRAYDEKMALTIDPDDDIRENIVSYHDEGAGEEDMQAYDITPLRIPINPKDSPGIGRKPMIPSEAKPSVQRPVRPRRFL